MRKYKYFIYTILCLMYIGNNLSAQDLNSAKKAFFEERYDEAKEIIDQFNKDTPSSSAFWYYRGLIYSAIASDVRGVYRDLDSLAVFKAYDALKKVMDKNDTSLKDSAKIALEKLYTITINDAASTFIKAGKTEDQTQQNLLYNKSLKTADLGQLLSSEKDTISFYISASSALFLKKYDSYLQAVRQLALRTPSKQQKLAYYKQMISISKDSLNRAKQNKKDTLTLDMLEDALKLFPQNQDFLDLRIEINARNKTYQQPKQDIKKKIKIDPSDANNYFNLAVLYYKQNNIEEALANFEKCVKIDPSHYEAIFHIGGIHYNKAVTTLRSINEMNYTEYTKKGKATEALAKKQFEKALPFFIQLKAMRPNNIHVLNTLRQLYKVLEMKDKEKRITEDIKKAHSSGK